MSDNLDMLDMLNKWDELDMLDNQDMLDMLGKWDKLEMLYK
jgi:hypothetical protein